MMERYINFRGIMIYCMSDIHGETDRFHQMLQQIELSPADHLFIIGDVIDRYPGGVDILQEIMSMPNITMLLGNHEDMCLKTLGPYNEFGARDLWKSNGGSCTYRELLYHMTSVGRREILRYLECLPIELDIEVEGRKYRLVHGWPGSNVEDKIWGRPQQHNSFYLPEDSTAIIGHTPTCYLDDDGESPFHIVHRPKQHFIAIDCGCGNQTPRRRLACLRLDDMKEYYV